MSSSSHKSDRTKSSHLELKIQYKYNEIVNTLWGWKYEDLKKTMVGNAHRVER